MLGPPFQDGTKSHQFEQQGPVQAVRRFPWTKSRGQSRAGRGPAQSCQGHEGETKHAVGWTAQLFRKIGNPSLMC